MPEDGADVRDVDPRAEGIDRVDKGGRYLEKKSPIRALDKNVDIFDGILHKRSEFIVWL